jgi:hypothetical protein
VFGFILGYLFSDPQSITSILLDVMKIGVVLSLTFTWFRLKAPIIVMKTETQKYKTEINDLNQRHRNELNERDRAITDRDLQIKTLTAELDKINDESNAPKILFTRKLTFQNLKMPAGADKVKGLVAQLDIINDSEREVYATPRLHFIDQGSGKAFKIEGMWSDSPVIEPKTTIAPPMNFLVGTRHKLDLAVKFDGETVWYGIDNASPHVKYRYKKYAFEGPMTIVVTLVGKTLRITRYFRIEEVNGLPKFEEIQFGVES